MAAKNSILPSLGFVGCVLLFLSLPRDAHALVNMRGAGASFPSEVYKSWMPMYKSSRQTFVNLYMDYQAIGSGGGKKLIKGEAAEKADPIEYAGSDSLLKEAEYVAYPDLQMLPTMAGYAISLKVNV